MIHQCPVCANTNTLPFFKFDRIPTHIHILYASLEEAKKVPCAPVDFYGCPSCGFGWNVVFDPKLVKYSQNYESTLIHSQRYIPTLKSVLEAMEPLGDDISLVEIGCGQGDFIKCLGEILGNRMSFAIGFDPAVRNPGRNGNIELASSFFSQGALNLDSLPNVALARHIIEHMRDPATFAKLMSDCPSVKKIAIETPNLRWILENKVYYEFLYEHCSLFMPETLLYLLNSLGFSNAKVDASLHHNLNMVVVGERTTNARKLAGHDFSKYFNGFSANTALFIENCRRIVREAHAKYGKIAISGAPGKGTIFASFLGDDVNLISSLIEINPRKCGHFLACTGIPIISPEESKKAGVKALIMLSDYYLEDVIKLHESIDMPVAIITAQEFRIFR